MIEIGAAISEGIGAVVVCWLICYAFAGWINGGRA